jgi:hypothetical protein
MRSLFLMLLFFYLVMRWWIISGYYALFARIKREIKVTLF